MIFFTKGAVTSSEHLYWKAASTAGKGMPRPPRRVGRAKIFLSNDDMDFLPIRAGMKVMAMASSRGCSISEMSWIVLKNRSICWIDHE